MEASFLGDEGGLPERMGPARPEPVPPREPQGLTAWERLSLCRRPDRPHALDYIKLIIRDFVELRGDRLYADDRAIVGGLGLLGDETVMVVGHQKTPDAKDILCRLGMPKPEGYRKALRLMKQAEQYGMPVISFIDTPGADPGIQSEERGQGQAIATNLFEMSRLRTPMISVVIGEGGSGGALAIGVTDRILMLENAIYSVVSPEGCAAILWKDASQAPKAAEAMRITARDLWELGITDEVLAEPAGGAHLDQIGVAMRVQDSLLRHLRELRGRFGSGNRLDAAGLLDERWQRFRRIGVFG
jgi:acetyl-CoA carboxylase carboxyl transferase subunit alpha